MPRARPPARASGTRSSWRLRSKAAPVSIKHGDVSSAPSDESGALRYQLIAALAAPAASCRSMSALAHRQEVEGWIPPEVARRDGGLWLLSATDIDRMVASAAPPSCPQEDHHADSDFSSRLVGDVLCTGRVPTISCTNGGTLPSRAVHLLRGGVACVLKGSGIFKAGVERWGDGNFLQANLKQHGCHVLVSGPSNKARFKYWREERNPEGNDRVPGNYEFSPPVKAEHMPFATFLKRSVASTGGHRGGGGTEDTARRECVYLQEQLLGADAQGRLVPAVPTLGRGMLEDISQGIDTRLLASIAQAGNFGPPSRCQLFVGASAAAYARTVLHFDQYDNCFMQLSGRKTFLLFDPLQSGRLYPYPIHHALDRSAQVDLEAPMRDQREEFPRVAGAKGCKVTLSPGDVLVLPAYWWHEVITEPHPGASGSDEEALTCSLNFWFSPVNKLFRPTLPLSPMLRVELARQLEFLVCDTLHDQPELVPRFFAAFSELVGSSASLAPDAVWAAMKASAPSGDGLGTAWVGLAEYVLAKLLHLLGAHGVEPFVRDMLDPGRFRHLKRRA